MSGWLLNATGYTVINAREYQRHLDAAERAFDFAMRADTARSAVSNLSAAESHLRKALQALGTVKFSIEHQDGAAS